ncbi:hypothetical protein EJ04DRAFT_530175 [Polyplosphaeria fusca]|uniref:Uncharacterized protein n=1 Tax=Polyplosphaeria fusca TaxID=682080 RepID=A0A9P4USB2_9PLEO|nr:hypothetical protein EJ04DRAFT_530175 [Polyplosphaeria fusca]
MEMRKNHTPSRRLLESQPANYRETPTPRSRNSGNRTQKRPDSGRPRLPAINMDSEPSEYETDGPGEIEELDSRLPNGPIRETPRIYEFDYSWVDWQRLAGYVADTRMVQRRASYWFYGVPIQYTAEGKTTNWYLCKDCHLRYPHCNALLRIDSGGSVLHHVNARHHIQYKQVKAKRILKVPTDKGLPALLAELDQTNKVQQTIHSKLVELFDPYVLQKKLLTWVVGDRIRFHKVSSDLFKQLFQTSPVWKLPARISSTLIERCGVFSDILHCL